MLEAFAPVTFENQTRGLQAVGQLLDRSGDDDALRAQFSGGLAAALADTAHPDDVLTRLSRYLDACPGARTHIQTLAAAPPLLAMLTTIFSQSDYLTDIVIRNPGYVSWLWDEVDLSVTRTREEMAADLGRQLDAFESFDTRCQSMRRFKRREFLRIALRDLHAHAPMREVTEDLSNLADACLDAAIGVAAEELRARFGAPLERGGGNEAMFCILAMGKLGGRELNFSSDVDLIFIYSEEGETAGGTSDPTTNDDYFHRLGQGIIKVIADKTTEDHVFRVDMRLRPHGRVGPLAVSLPAALTYYERTGQAWERQALVKARACAGDLALGERFIERARPFVFPRYFDDATLEDIRQVKGQMETLIESRGQTDTEVKLGKGGIRDIEFTVQMLQLLNGGRTPELRRGNTLDAIARLGEHNLLRPLEADALTRNYIFLRNVEHRLQVRGSQQIHALPQDPGDLDDFARRLGYDNASAFMDTYRQRTEENRMILERFLAAEGGGTRWIYDLLHPHGGGEAGLARLSELGFGQPGRAQEELMTLYAGPAERPNGLRVRQQFTAVAPVLLQAMSECASPDRALMHLTGLLETVHAPGAMYDVLKVQPHLAKYLVTLIDNSEYLTNLLIREPGLFDTFGYAGALDTASSIGEMRHVLGALVRAAVPEAAPCRFKNGETLRVGMRDLFTAADVFEVGSELTNVAEVCVGHLLGQAHARAEERHGSMDGGFGVLALGKMAGRELGYGSDLDLVFVYDGAARAGSDTGPAEFFAAVASNLLKALKERTRHGTLYDVDPRLRPDGNKGVLAVSLDRLRDYYTNDAQDWERLALVKARPVAGDPEFLDRLAATAREAAFGRPFTPAEVRHIAELREKLSKAAGPLDLKKHTGGIVGLEFATRLLQVRFADGGEDLFAVDVRGALGALCARGAVGADEAANLLDAYTLLRRVENRIRMAHGTPGSELPENPADQADLARRLGIEGDLVETVAGAKACVRAYYDRVIRELAEG
jgi:[glutamine synthetase] adenylyltransferase / [glutamine synthetase]-adenylyl-L-tyrosine phosphorylase